MEVNIFPQGYRVLVKTDEVEETVGEAGIVIVEDKKIARASKFRGTVVAVGPLAFKGFKEGNGEPWCKVGDRIYYAQYAGKPLLDPITKEEYTILNDEDVVATLRDEVSDA